MRWLCTARFARILAASLSLVTLAGCPELNHWSGPTQDPFFSIADPLPRAQMVRESEPRRQLDADAMRRVAELRGEQRE